MKVDSIKIWNYIQSESEDSIKDRILKILEMCKTSFPDERWEKLYEFDWNTITEQFKLFFDKEIEDIISKRISGLYFGITTVILTNGDSSFALEAGGTSRCNFNDKEFNWIFNLEWRGTPLICDALYQIYKYANIENGLGNDIEWPFGLAISIFGIDAMMKQYEQSKRLENKINIVVGFHDGDMMLLKGINQET